LSTVFPWLHFTPTLIYRTLLYFHVPEDIPTGSGSNYLSLVSTIQFSIWKGYWNFYINQVPFDSDTVLSFMLQQFRTLTLD
jgi:hypothetical protein